jgi:hypothetical protein
MLALLHFHLPHRARENKQMHPSKSFRLGLNLALLAGFLLSITNVFAQTFGRDGSLIPDTGLGAGDQSCLVTSPVPGCNDEACEAEVCAIDSYCCAVNWDGICVTEANALCGDPGEGARATFEVTKDFSDDNPAGVEVTLSCNTGLPLEQSKVITEGDGVVFVVTDYDDGEMNCEVTESVPAGYSPTYHTGFVDGSSSVSCSWSDLPWGASAFCNITNNPDPVEVVIEKVWVIEGDNLNGVSQEFRVDLFCDSQIEEGDQSNGEWHAFADGEGDATFTFHVIPEFPDTECTVEESVFDSAVESDNGCGTFTVSAGDGHECTITNTVFFEGIPTLNQYGAAILALLMLGVGFIGFRRFT